MIESRLRDDSRIGILVNNAGMAQSGSFVEQTGADIEGLIMLNSTALARLAAAVAPRFVQEGGGAIVNIGSVNGLSTFGDPAYSAAKAGLIGLTRALAREFGPRGVRVNCIAPGLIRTDMARALWENPENLKRSTAASTLKRIGEPHEIAGAAVFLASKAGAFTTGQTIVCDGGATISGGA